MEEDGGKSGGGGGEEDAAMATCDNGWSGDDRGEGDN